MYKNMIDHVHCAGKTLIQKYECTDEEGLFYKNVSTYSGWTPATRFVLIFVDKFI
jgi:hypothetical protein